MPNKHFDSDTIALIENILKKGGSIEIRKRRNEIVIIEISGKLIKTIPE